MLKYKKKGNKSKFTKFFGGHSPPSLIRYTFLLSSLSLFRILVSASFPASPLSTARTTSNMRACNMNALAIPLPGSGVSTLLPVAKTPFCFFCLFESNWRETAFVSSTRDMLCTFSASSRQASAWDLSLKQTNPVPRERPVSLSIVMRA